MIGGCNSLANKDIREGKLVDLEMFLFGGAILFGLVDNFVIEFAYDGGSIDVEVGGVFDFWEDGPIVIFAFVLHEDTFVDH